MFGIALAGSCFFRELWQADSHGEIQCAVLTTRGYVGCGAAVLLDACGGVAARRVNRVAASPVVRGVLTPNRHRCGRGSIDTFALSID